MNNILVLGQNPHNTSVILSSLAKAEIEQNKIQVVETQAQLLNEAVQVQPGLIILDVDMSTEDGLELCQLLKANSFTKHITLIVFGSEARMQGFRRAFEAGADYYVPGNVATPKYLIRVVEEVLHDSTPFTNNFSRTLALSV